MASVPSRPKFEAYLKNEEAWPLQDVLDAARQMEALAAQPGWQMLVRLIDDGRESLWRNLALTATLPQEEYARAMGTLAALEIVRTLPDTVARVAESRKEKAEKIAEQRKRAESREQEGGSSV